MVKGAGLALAVLVTALGQARPCCCWLDFLQAPANEQASAAPGRHSCCGVRTPAPAAPCAVDSAPRACNCPTVKECSIPYRETTAPGASGPFVAEFPEAGRDSSRMAEALARVARCNAFDLPPPDDLCVLHHTLLI